MGYLAFPTYPTYDSFYALLWGRDLLHLHLPDFQVYRGPTEHPLAIAFGMLCSIFGQGGRAPDGARLDRLLRGGRRRHVPARAPVLRPARRAARGAAALSRFFDENLAAQGYLDISYVALIIWAVVLEVERPRRGDGRAPRARRRRPAATGRVGAERRLLAVVRLAATCAGERGRAGRARAPIDNRERLKLLALARSRRSCGPAWTGW